MIIENQGLCPDLEAKIFIKGTISSPNLKYAWFSALTKLIFLINLLNQVSRYTEKVFIGGKRFNSSFGVRKSEVYTYTGVILRKKIVSRFAGQSPEFHKRFK